MKAIFGRQGVKAGFFIGPAKTLIRDAARELIKRGAEVIIAGCTEVPLVLKDRDIPVPLIDPMRIAALACIRKAGYKNKA
jgi:aspartate racemase